MNDHPSKLEKKMRRIMILAEQEEVKKIESHVQKVIKALGHSDALVTDESIVSDFLTINFKNDPKFEKIRAKELKNACKKLKMEIGVNELIINVAKRLIKDE